ncbi:hypothetical protein L1987_13258 [Smallanthus sonchifolius]|uniref:Uncharacterized protein n=1 Tax=Smallanthus sonchifolius TaxID=185202 RepID=A0ACB9JGV5_9ASTR|nr:hypothetical protein L1987_13258 [Smallanthus sonchifolius]
MKDLSIACSLIILLISLHMEYHYVKTLMWYGSTKYGLRQLQSSLLKECRKSKGGIYGISGHGTHRLDVEENILQHEGTAIDTSIEHNS